MGAAEAGTPGSKPQGPLRKALTVGVVRTEDACRSGKGFVVIVVALLGDFSFPFLRPCIPALEISPSLGHGGENATRPLATILVSHLLGVAAAPCGPRNVGCVKREAV